MKKILLFTLSFVCFSYSNFANADLSLSDLERKSDSIFFAKHQVILNLEVKENKTKSPLAWIASMIGSSENLYYSKFLENQQTECSLHSSDSGLPLQNATYAIDDIFMDHIENGEIVLQLMTFSPFFQKKYLLLTCQELEFKNKPHFIQPDLKLERLFRALEVLEIKRPPIS